MSEKNVSAKNNSEIIFLPTINLTKVNSKKYFIKNISNTLLVSKSESAIRLFQPGEGPRGVISKNNIPPKIYLKKCLGKKCF